MRLALSEEDRQVLSELLETGVSASAEKIGQLSKTDWDVVASSVRELNREQALAMFREDTEACFGGRLKSRSLLPMEIVILYPGTSGRSIADAVAKAGTPRLKAMPDFERVILGEISNILGQGIIKAMVDRLKVSVILSVPQMLHARRADILAGALSDFDEDMKTLLLSHVQMNSTALSAECGMLLVFDTAVLKRMIEVAGAG